MFDYTGKPIGYDQIAPGRDRADFEVPGQPGRPRNPLAEAINPGASQYPADPLLQQWRRRPRNGEPIEPQGAAMPTGGMMPTQFQPPPGGGINGGHQGPPQIGPQNPFADRSVPPPAGPMNGPGWSISGPSMPGQAQPGAPATATGQLAPVNFNNPNGNAYDPNWVHQQVMASLQKHGRNAEQAAQQAGYWDGKVAGSAKGWEPYWDERIAMPDTAGLKHHPMMMGMGSPLASAITPQSNDPYGALYAYLQSMTNNGQ